MCALVTGVQTCALPIFVSVLRTNQSGAAQAERERHAVFSILGGGLVVQLVVDALRTRDMTLSSLDSVGSLAVILRIVTAVRSEEHTSELQSLMRRSYAVFGLKKDRQ